MTRRRDRQNELVVAVIVVSALALALTFGIVLNLASRSNENDATATLSDEILINNPSPTLPTVTPQVIETRPPTLTATYTSFPQPSDTAEATVTDTPESSATATIEPSVSPTPAATDTATPEPSVTPAPSETPSPEPSATPSRTARPSATRSPEVVIVGNTQVPTETVTPEPTTAIPSPTDTQPPSATSQPSLTATDRPNSTASPTPSRTASATRQPSNTPTLTATADLVTPQPTRTLWPTRLPSYRLDLPTWTPTITPFPTATFTPFAATMTPTLDCEPPRDWVPYQVKRGDILFEIALQSGISTNALREANCIVGSRIITGQILYVPPTSALAMTPTMVYQRQGCGTASIQISSPLAGASVGATLTVRGIATTEFFDYYTLALRADYEPQFQEVYRQYQAVASEGVLATLPVSRPAGLYWLELRVYNPWGDAVDSCAVPIIFN